jgi:DNA-binding transcriptional regulator YbjK
MNTARSARHQQSHERILDAAARAVRRAGIAGFTPRPNMMDIIFEPTP